MNYFNTADQLNFIVVICFSFSITAYSLIINKEKNLSRLLGLCFSIPFLMSVFASIQSNIQLATYMVSYSQVSLLLAVFIFLLAKPKSKSHSFAFTLVIAYTMTIFLLVSYSNEFLLFFTTPQVDILMLIFTSLLIMFILRKEKGNKSLIFWASLIILAENSTKLVLDKPLTDYLSLLGNICAYSMLMVYFYRETMGKIFQKIQYTEKQLEAVDKNLNLEVKKRVLEIERSNEMLVNLSKTDALTKALNKAAILDTLKELITSAKPGTEISILMFDIDNFKTINDTSGHITGDKCIKRLALIAKNNLRDLDYLGRYGGDEFIIILPDTALHQAKLVAERFRKQVEETTLPHFTVSIGISSFPQDGHSVKELIAAADDGLYHSKRRGRNAVSYKNLY